MSDPLWGVALGGLIGAAPGIISAITAAYFEKQKWKRQAKLEWLKSERVRLEAFYKQTMETITNALQADTGTYPISLLADIVVLLPKDVVDLFRAGWANYSAKQGVERIAAQQTFQMDIAAGLRRDLKRIDDAISKLVT